MLPTQGGILLQGGTPLVPAAQRPSRTYRADFAAGRIDGFTDGREAMEQAIYQILHTERFAWPIYSWNYGAELGRLTGRSVRVAQPPHHPGRSPEDLPPAEGDVRWGRAGPKAH